MNKNLFHTDELLAAIRTPDGHAIGQHLSDDEFIHYSMGTLSHVDEEAIDTHLAVCRDCAHRMDHLLSESRPWTSDNGRQHVSAIREVLLKELTRKANGSDSDETQNDNTDVTQDEWPNLQLRTHDELDVLALLVDLNVIETEYDYVLPSGFHCDTYINTGKLCRSEEGLRQIARAFDKLVSDIEFDVVVCNGWATGMIARRLARERANGSDYPLRVVVTEGYSEPSFAEDLSSDSRVLILVDVSITGRLVGTLKARIQNFGAVVVGAACIAVPSAVGTKARQTVRALLVLDMELNDPARGHCPRCAVLRKLVFNPISSQMTVKKLASRSPTQFLEDFPQAVTFWEAVNTAHAYEHHRIEDNTHYVAFVNTAKMVAHPTVGPQLVISLLDLVTKVTSPPQVILVPDRVRARLLAEKVVEALKARGSATVELFRAQRRQGFWRITAEVQRRIVNKNVLVLDSAAGHGYLLDELTLLATESMARAVSAAVLLSRLTLSCEAAFKERLHGRFHRLFHLPIRPVAIRSTDRSLCPVCREKALIQQAAYERQDEALVTLARQIASRRKRSPESSAEDKLPPAQLQLLLFDVPQPPLLQRCHRAVASGITLHALHTAMTDGMAPLALPELRNTHIPAQNRVAMLEHLPQGVLAWSDNHLDQSIEDVLSEGQDESVWLASADILAREGKTYWVAYLKSFLERSDDLQSKPHDTFWNRLAYGAYRVSLDDADVRDEINGIARQLLHAYRDTVSANGLRRVAAVVAPTDASMANE